MLLDRRPHWVDLYRRAGGWSFVAATPGEAPAATVDLGGTYTIGDRLGVERIVPDHTEEPLTAAELVELARDGKFNFKIVKASS